MAMKKEWEWGAEKKKMFSYIFLIEPGFQGGISGVLL